MTAGVVDGKTLVRARPAAGRSFTVDDFAALTSVPVLSVGWDEGWLVVSFDGVLTAGELAAAQRRLVSAGLVEEALRAELEEFLDMDPTDVTEATLRVQLRHVALLLLSQGLPEGSIPAMRPSSDDPNQVST